MYMECGYLAVLQSDWVAEILQPKSMCIAYHKTLSYGSDLVKGLTRESTCLINNFFFFFLPPWDILGALDLSTKTQNALPTAVGMVPSPSRQYQPSVEQS